MKLRKNCARHENWKRLRQKMKKDECWKCSKQVCRSLLINESTVWKLIHKNQTVQLVELESKLPCIRVEIIWMKIEKITNGCSSSLKRSTWSAASWRWRDLKARMREDRQSLELIDTRSGNARRPRRRSGLWSLSFCLSAKKIIPVRVLIISPTHTWIARKMRWRVLFASPSMI